SRLRADDDHPDLPPAAFLLRRKNAAGRGGPSRLTPGRCARVRVFGEGASRAPGIDVSPGP
ncbi:MAG: hypothetical protein AAFU79_20920, partial [Myxococcota bacterium]